MSNSYKGTIDLQKLNLPTDKPAGRVAGMIVGKKASNLKRLTREVPGTSIKVFSGKSGENARVPLSECDRVSIMGGSPKDVGKVAKMIKQDIEAYLDPSKECSRPRGYICCSKEVAAILIGKGGKALKEFVGGEGIPSGVFVVHSRRPPIPDGGFMITGDSMEDVETTKAALSQKAERVQSRLDARKEAENVEVSVPAPIQLVDLSDFLGE